MTTNDGVDAAWSAYEIAEKRYLDALSRGDEDETLASEALAVAAAAQAVEVADVAGGPSVFVGASGEVVSKYYEAPEVLSTLWADVAAAYERRRRRG